MDFIAIDNALFFRPQTIGIFLTPPLNISCGYSSESPRRGDSDEDDNICFNGGIRKNIHVFICIFILSSSESLLSKTLHLLSKYLYIQLPKGSLHGQALQIRNSCIR